MAAGSISLAPEIISILEAMPGLIDASEGRRLAELAASVPADQAIVEIGAHRGLSSCWLAAGSVAGNGAKLTSIDLWPEGDAIDDRNSAARWAEAGALDQWRRNIASIGAKGVATAIRSTGINVAASWPGPPVGLWFHDAEHSSAAVAADYRAWLPLLAPGAWVAVHDYYGNVPDGYGGWARTGTHQTAVEKVLLPSGRWTDIDIVGSVHGPTIPNLWLGRRDFHV